jgi:hypothetical protein
MATGVYHETEIQPIKRAAKALLDGKVKSYGRTVAVSTTMLKRLLDAVEAAAPRTVNVGLHVHREGQTIHVITTPKGEVLSEKQFAQHLGDSLDASDDEEFVQVERNDPVKLATVTSPE